MMISSVQGRLQVHRINEENGYVKIRLKQVEIADNTDTILHIIDPTEIEMILTNLESNVAHLRIEDKETLSTEISLIRSKLKTIRNPGTTRQKRGLVNIIGRGLNFLFGTMDDKDKEEIQHHLQNIEENNQGAIYNLNKQIKINEHFNQTLTDLKVLIENDRDKILEAINTTNKSLQELNYKIMFLDQETKLRYLENKIDQILDNIMATRNKIVHPSMLTLNELETYKVDFHKLKLLKAGVMEYKKQFLIFAIKIPKNYILTELQLIKPITNSECLEINEPEELIVEISNKTFQYKEETLLKDLRLSQHCIFRKTCNLIYNNITTIEEIDSETILVKNIYNETILHNCDKRMINLTGNYLINFNNCSLSIKNNKFYNKKMSFLEKYYYPSKETNITFVKPIDFNKIIIGNIDNISEIQELKYHKNMMYGTSISTIVLLIGIISYIMWKNKREQINIINMKPETSDSKRGGVTYINIPDTLKKSETTPDISETYSVISTAKPMAW